MNDTIKLTLKPVQQIYPKNNLFSHNDFYIYDCLTENKKVELNSRGYLSIKGKIQKLDLNINYKAEIKFAEKHPTFGTSYWIQNIYQDIPDTIEEQKDYLKSILTELQVEAIYKVYPNTNIIQMFKDDTFDYSKVHGFGKYTYERVKKKILDNLEFKELLSQLGKYGITYTIIKKLVDKFGSPQLAIKKIKENPYELIQFDGIGFKKADAIALNMQKIDLKEKIEKGEITREEADNLFQEYYKSPFRIQAGIIYIIEQEQENGHTYITRENLIKECYEKLFVDHQFIEEQIKLTKDLYIKDDRISLLYTFNCEKFIASTAKKMLDKTTELDFNPDEFIQKIEQKYKNIMPNGLSKQQKEFFHNFKKYNFQLLIGYAGTGKSMLQKLLYELLEELKLSSLWLTPTASAAKVLTNYLEGKAKATTIHRGIMQASKSVDEDEEENIGILEDVIIVDEFSMVDVFLCARLLTLLKNPNVRVLFVGDSFQNVAISCGNILQNMIDSKKIPMTILTEVFRQKEGGILDIATRIRLQQRFLDNDFVGTKKFGNNLFFCCMKWEKDRPSERMDEAFMYYYKYFIEKKNYQPQDILSMSPTKKSKLGTITLNKKIQEYVNPYSEHKKEINFIKEKNEDKHNNDDTTYTKLRVGDYVVNTKNTYEIFTVDKKLVDVVNGDTGLVEDIIIDWKPQHHTTESLNSLEENKNGIYIQFDDNYIKFDHNDKEQLLHAWCMTIHKAQGMGNKVSLLVFDKSHTYGMNANMLYVALTRATDYAIVICQAKVLNDIMKKFANLSRNTWLEELLTEEFEKEKLIS